MPLHQDGPLFVFPKGWSYPGMDVLMILSKPFPAEARHLLLSKQCHGTFSNFFQFLCESSGPYCNRTWDGWLCWDDTPAGVLSHQYCPDYFPDFDPTEKVTKYCDENGDWYKHPENNRTWSNYTMCNAFTPEKLKNAYVLYYLAIVGHSLSIFTLVISLGIFVFFKSLGCQRVTLHKNMFLTYILNSMIIIIHLVEVVPNGELVRRDPVSIA
ncbi:hypothetical protein GH733_013271 [Mirounga leonina]|nr:hypothetical protein GH733_013271 [Mirounga leonina]